MRGGRLHRDVLLWVLLCLVWIFAILGTALTSAWLLAVGAAFALLFGARFFSPLGWREGMDARALALFRAARVRLARTFGGRQAKSVHFLRCPACDARLRVRPRVGRFTVRCPRCEARFSVEYGENGEERIK